MADSRAVKSLNKSEGRKRYVFKKLDKRMAEIEINVFEVFRSLDKVKDKPSQGSTYLKDCLVEFRELYTAADFILFYEEMLPFVQTLPLVLIHQDLIFSKLVSSLYMKARFSLEPFLRLISALSRDLLDGFLPFLPRVVNSIVTLLRNGGQKDSDILEQIFLSWSYIVRDLHKYLICDIESILRDTLELRYYPGEYINKFMSPSISFLLRTARDEQLKIGIKRILSEVAADPLKKRGGVSLVLYHVMRGTSVHLHSKAGQVLRFLLKDSTLSFCDHFPQGSGSIVVEALSSTLQRICKDFKAEELCVMWKCLYEETTESIKNKETAHLSRLLTLLTSIVRVEKGLKVYDYPYLVGLVSQIVPTFLDSSDVLDKVLGLMLCTIDRPSAADEMESIANQWAPIFSFKCSSSLLLSFLWELLRKEDKLILKAFTSNILSWINNMILVSPEEVFPLLLSLCESHDKAKMRDEPFENKFERIHEFLEGKIKKIQRNIGLAQIEEAELAAAWGAVECFPYFKVDSSLLICFKNTLIQHLAASVVNTTSSAPELMWQSLLGAALRSCHKFCSSGRINHLRPCHKSRSTGRLIHSNLEEALSLAKSYKSCVQVLSPVADYLDVAYRSLLAKNDISKACPELLANNAEDAFDIFSENLCHSKKDVRLMTLRILCHFETLYPNPCFEEHPPPMKKLKTQVIQKSFPESNNVLELLKSVEESHLTLSTETKLVRDITTMKTDLSACRIHEAYVPLVYKGMIGLFHNQFPKIWEPVSECLAVLMKKHTGAVWNDFVHYLGQCQLKLEALDNHHSENENYSISHKHTGLIERFNSFVLGPSGRTQPTEKGKVVSLLLKTLQKVPDVAQSRVSDLLPLLMKFLGYNSENPLRVGLYNGGACKGEEWKGLLIQWLTLLKLMKNPRSCCFSQFVNDVLQNRFLDHYDAEIQMSVLECIVLWNDYLIPHRHRLENLIKPKELREELATWNFSKDIEEAHRCHFVSLVIRILMPKVRNLKNSASRKRTSIRHRKAVLGVISQLDVDELALFFALLMKPLNIISEEATDLFWSSGKSSLDYFQKSNFLKSINADTILTLSWKKKSGFLHVIQHILEVFDVFHVQPFLDFLMGCVVRLLTTYDPNIDVEKSVATNHNQAGTCLTQFKEMRSLCLKIIARVLEKYEDCDLGSEFWDLFLSAVNSLIKSFKQEGSSSEKPSSLFSCFLSMSKSRSLVTLLCRQESLVPDIFSILTVTTASEAIKSSALSFIENLLSLESDLDDDDDHMIKGFLDPYVEALINSLHSLFRGDILKRKSFKYHGEREIKILKLLSKHIRDESTVMEYLDILLSFLDKRVKDSDIHREALLAIQDMTWLLGSESSSKIIVRVSPLLVDAELDVRLCICHLLDSLSKIDISLDLMAKCVSHMNATSPMEVDDLDYETIRKAYGKIDADFFAKSSEQYIMIILSQSLYNLSSSEVTLKDCAFNLLCTFIEFSASILCQEASAHSDTGKEISKSDASCIGDRVLWIINKFILKHIGDALNRGISSGKEEILLIRKMVTKLPDSGNLAAFRPLCSDNDDIDFFKNVFSIQIQRRRKAIKSFAKEMRDSSLPEGIVRKLLVSVFFNMLLDGQEKNRKGQDRKVKDLHDACAEALASVSAHMSWCSYLALLNRCFREMKKHTTEEKRKHLVNLVCSILDKFHFAKDGLYEQEVRACLEKTLFPKIQKLMDSESDSVALRSFVAAVKVLKLLPKEIMESNLDSLVHKISKYLRNREDRTRNEARKVLADCLKELGLEAYLQLFLKKIVSLFKKGSEVHVLGYTVNFILSECLPNPTGWMLDHCLETLLYVVEADIFGDVDDEHREYSSRRKTKKETKRRKSLDTLRLIAENVTFRSHALKLLSLVTRQLKRPMTSNLKSKIGDMLKHIAFGIESNPSVDQGDLFCFIYHRVDDGINNRSCLGDQASSLPSKKKRKSRHVQETCGGKSCPHLITLFALDLLHNRLKKIQPSNTNEEVVSKLDPFVKLLVGCLSSKYEDVVSSSVSCFTALIRLPLPSLKSEAGDVKTQVLAIIAKSAVSSSSPLVQSGKKLLKALLGNENFTFSSGELNMLIQLPMFVDLESDPSVDSLNASLSLVKAIVKRKVPKLYDVADQVSKLMITHGDESVRKKCKELQLDLLVNYTLSKKRLDGHFNFLLKSLSYEHSTGREVVLKVLEDVIEKFSQPKLGKKSVLDQQSQILFVELTRRLATDDAKESLSKICGLMKLLLGRISNYNSFLELCLAWYKQEKTHAKAAQVLGFFIEVRKEAFSEHIHSILLEEAIPILESAVQLQNTVEEGSIPFWKEAYYSLVMIEKLLKQFPDLCFAKHLEDVWKGVFKLLLHPHEWLQIITCRLLNYYFKKLAESPRTVVDDSLLGKPSSLFMVASSLCFQLKVEMRPSRVNKNNDAIPEEDIVTQNIVFAVSGLHSRIGESDDEYWSSLDKDEQAEFLKAFVLFDSGKVRSTFLALTSGSERSQDDVRNVLIGSLLKRMGELALDMDLIHTRIVRIVLSVYKEFASNLNQGECRLYALRIMFPLYKVCQGFTGKVISPELKQLAEEVRDSIRDKSLGSQMFVQVYSEIQKSLEAKREKRKREEKLMAVVNPERNAKRKLKLASKNKANKKRRIMSSKMQRWSRS